MGDKTISGTRKGGLTTKAKMLALDPDYYKKLGAKGGKAHNKGGFNDRELARRAGALGGRQSKRD